MKVVYTLLVSIVIIMTLDDIIPSANGEKILVVSFMASKSHKNVYEPLFQELANRGNIITVITPVKSSKPHKNIREIIGMTWEDVMKLYPQFDVFQMRLNNTVMNPFSMVGIFETLCRSYYEMTEVKDLLKEKFDLVITSSFMNECTYGLLHHFNTTSMFINPHPPASWTAAITGTPSPPSFVPISILGSTHRMNFKERFVNFVATVGISISTDLFYIPTIEKIYREYLGENTPSVHEIGKNVSLILSNSHFTLNYPRPYMPDIVEVGGMHCRPSKPLPKALDDFLTGSGKDGFIYFSMGSVIKAHTMPENVRNILLGAFSKLKQRVLWKWETETMPDLPKNVKLSKWLPQQDVLGHPNIKMFITHGGLLSTEEAVYHGVPLVGIPMFSDQDWNMKQAETTGFALTLDFNKLSEEKIIEAVNRIIKEPRFLKRAKEISIVFKDRPQTPLDTALFWTEYIMRHKGAVHLRSPARDLNTFQYHSLDVIAVLAGIIFAIFYTSFAILRCLFRKICRSKKPVDLKKKNK